MIARPLMSSAMRSNNDNYWPVHSLMSSLHDSRVLPLRRLPSTVPRCMISVSISWRQTWTNHDNSRPGEDIDLLPYVLVRFMFSLWYAKHLPVSSCLQRLGFASPDSQLASSSHTCRPVLTRRAICKSLVFVRKLIALFFFFSLYCPPCHGWLYLCQFHP